MADRKKTLRDDDIRDAEVVSRRGFGRLLVSALGAGGTAAVAACVPAGGGGYTPISNPSGPYTGISDGDAGNFADAAGYGRGTYGGSGNYTGLTDGDTGNYADAAGYGSGQTYTGLTDSDGGGYADQAGYGRSGY